MKRLCILLILSLTASLAGAQVAVREVRREVVLERLNHPGTKPDERQTKLKELFEKAGCGGDRLREQPVKRSRLGNVVCTLPGTGADSIIVGAHFDCIDEGYGIVDNWSGASLLPSLYESLASRPRKHTYIFVGFTDEEKGMVGSEAYARQMTPVERTHTHAMVNLDTLGLGTTNVWLSHSDKTLVNYMLKVAGAMKLPLGAVNFEQVGATDSVSFEDLKIPSITIHSVTPMNYQVLHTTQDRPSSIRHDDYYNSYRLTAVFLAYLDNSLERRPEESKSGR